MKSATNMVCSRCPSRIDSENEDEVRGEQLCRQCANAVRDDLRFQFDRRFPGKTLVRVCSHRARHKLQSLVGFKNQLPGLFSFSRNGEWRVVSNEIADKALSITGVRRAKWSDDLREYWYGE